MKIHLLGTGSSTGTPQLLCNCAVCTSENSKNKRTRFSLLIETGYANILVDVPFETRLQLLNAKATHLDAVWLTHHHSDHFAGIDDLRIFSFKNDHPIPFFALDNTMSVAKERFSYLFFKNDYMERPFLDPVIIEKNKSTYFKGLEIIPILHKHGEMDVASFRIGDFAFLADISTIDDAEKEKLYDLKYFVVSSTVLHPHYKHLNLEQVISLVSELAPQKAILTHMNHRYDYDSINEQLPDFMEAGYDGMVFEV